MKATQTGFLNLSPALSTQAKTAYVLDELKTGTLISLSQLCDDDCIAIFTRYDVKIVKNDSVIIESKRRDNGL